MLNNLSAEIRECHRHAGDCARQAAAQTDPKIRGLMAARRFPPP